jgi:type IV pilus assembly protein PilP
MILRKSYLQVLGLLSVLFILAACGNSGEEEVQQWMEKTRQETRSFTPKLQEPKDFIPFTYDKKDDVDPFNPSKLQSALAKLSPGSGNGIKPDFDRRREALEFVPLDTMKMVGTITEAGVQYALIEVDGKNVSQVKVGNYIGQDYGLVTKVDDDSIEIKEIYLDTNGDWAERVQTLELQEAGK